MKRMTKAGALLLALGMLFSLASCAAPAAQPAAQPSPAEPAGGQPAAPAAFTYADTIQWDGQYDVVVIGFGFAGATTAITAADEGASVLISEKAPEAEAGGNSRVCHQLFASVDDVQGGIEYYSGLRGIYDSTSDEILRTYVEGIAKLPDYVAFLGADKSKFTCWKGSGISTYDWEHPEIAGGEHYTAYTITDKVADGALYQLIKQNVADRAGKVDVWYESPSKHLIQDPVSKTIIGVQVEREGKLLNIRANNGVVMACGGFENNDDMLECYLGMARDHQQFGTAYNTGDGIYMALEVGAKLWHMANYEPGGGAFGSMMAKNAAFVALAANPKYGAVMAVGPDGTRFINEDGSNLSRHGHIYYAGSYTVPKFPAHVYGIFGEATVTAMHMEQLIEAELSQGNLVKADSFEELGEKLGMQYLAETAKLYNGYCKNGVDEQFRRDPATLTPFGAGPYYAYEFTVSSMLNTQGGPERNEHAEILGADGNPIPNLYSAGEFGAITANMDQGGTNVGECLVFGQIAGKNAAASKAELPIYQIGKVESNPVYLPGYQTDLVAEKTYDYPMGENEYMGVGKGGMGGDIVVKVTVEGDAITKIEVLEQHETPGTSDPAFNKIPDAILSAQSAEVDTISGCTLSSKVLIAAVADALVKAK